MRSRGASNHSTHSNACGCLQNDVRDGAVLVGSTVAWLGCVLCAPSYLAVQELAVFKDGAAKFQGSSSSSSKQVEGDTSDLTGARLVTTMIVSMGCHGLPLKW